ncbi:zinc finger BED domain-containing protein RICESLEEPER 4-like [Panicum virgatum]|nr:zinc finger BED domain-containing protein RICESLEEPER 4-like [Panicum virgatum]
MLREVVIPMKSKYLKYWNDIPLLYSIAFIMDPRAKIKGFSNALRLLSSLTGTDYSAYFTSVRAALSDMFGKYESKFGSIRLARPTHKPSTGKKKAQWGKIFGDGSTSTTSPGSGLGSVGAGGSFTVPLGRRTSASALLQAASTGGTYESTFSLTGRIIEERRRQLKPEMVEMLTCIKDWEAADERAQHMVEDGDLQAAYEDQYLDETPAQAAV